MGTIGVAKGLSGVVPVVSAQDMWITISKSQRDAVEVDCAVYEGLEALSPKVGAGGQGDGQGYAEVVAEVLYWLAKRWLPHIERYAEGLLPHVRRSCYWLSRRVGLLPEFDTGIAV